MEKVQTLDMTVNGLGNLTEYRLLVLFGNMHSMALVEGTDIRPDEIVDSEDRLLYPAYYMTHIKVPINSFIEDYCLWDKVKSIVEVRRFGVNLLDSHYSIQKCNNLGEVVGNPIIMDANSMFIVDATLDKCLHRTSSIPRVDRIASLEKMKQIPVSLKRFNVIRKEGFGLNEGEAIGTYTFQYKIIENRDVSINHSLMFAKFTEIMDMGERKFLFEENIVGFPEELTRCIRLLERETYYYSNCFSGDTVECNISINLEKCINEHLSVKDCNACFYLNESFELYEKKTRNLLVISKARKVISIPTILLFLKDDITRILCLK